MKFDIVMFWMLIFVAVFIFEGEPSLWDTWKQQRNDYITKNYVVDNSHDAD